MKDKIYDVTAHTRWIKLPISTKFLVISSCFFLIPGYYAFLLGLYWYLATSAITTIVSINYWRYAVPGLRRSLDMVIAKISFTIYFVTGVLNINNLSVLYISWPLCGGILTCYYYSKKMWEKNSETWIFYHMMFHVFVAIGQCVVLYGSFHSLWWTIFR